MLRLLDWLARLLAGRRPLEEIDAEILERERERERRAIGRRLDS